MNNLRLVISGPPGSGRSTFAEVIAEFCKLYGFQVDVTDANGAPSDAIMSNGRRFEMTDRLQRLGEGGGKVSIITNQTPREGFKAATSVDFEVGNRYRTAAGKLVKLVERKDRENGESTVLGDDGLWRYNRDSDRGRVTGSPHDFSSPDNLTPLYAHNVPGELESLRMELKFSTRKVAQLETALAAKQ